MLTKDVIIKINQGIIAEWNEKNPTNKESFQVAEDRLDDVLELAKKHTEPIEQACYLLAGIAWAQPFSGGNKRTAFISADTLLAMHGYRLQITTDGDIEYLRSLLFEIQEARGELGLMESYLDKITPQVSDKWRSDEMFFKVKGNPKYLYALMDDETRFWIAKQVSDTKFTSDVRPMFREGAEIAGKNPKVLITDGAHNFMDGFKKEYWTLKSPKSVHIRHIHIKGDMNNNKMERLNNEIRDREKVMRGLKKEDSPILTGYQIYHNYVRSHMALDGETPADKAGIRIEGNNKWITLIQNASRS